MSLLKETAAEAHTTVRVCFAAAPLPLAAAIAAGAGFRAQLQQAASEGTHVITGDALLPLASLLTAGSATVTATIMRKGGGAHHTDEAAEVGHRQYRNPTLAEVAAAKWGSTAVLRALCMARDRFHLCPVHDPDSVAHANSDSMQIPMMCVIAGGPPPCAAVPGRPGASGGDASRCKATYAAIPLSPIS